MNAFWPTKLFLIIIVCALAAVDAQAAAFIERGLPGNSFAGLVPAPNGRLYGVNYEERGVNKGTLYSVDATLSAPPAVHVTFTGPNGATPYDELTYDAASGRFYGGTFAGGTTGLGTIFAFDPTTNVLTTLKDDFDSSIYEPRGPLVVSGDFIYGVVGRPSGGVFRMKTDGSGYKIIHYFADFGTLPQGVTLGGDGKLYGVSIYGGVVCNPSVPNQTCGTVYRLNPILPADDAGGAGFETLYQMHNEGADAGPQRTVTYGSDGLIYFNNHRRIYRLNPADPAATFQKIWDELGGTISMAITEGPDHRIYAVSYGSSTSP